MLKQVKKYTHSLYFAYVVLALLLITYGLESDLIKYCHLFKKILLPKGVLSILIAILGPVILYLLQRQDTLEKQIGEARPLWKIMSYNKEVQFFTTGEGRTVVDNIRYYYLIFDSAGKVKSINLKNGDNEEIKDFYPGDNAIAESSEPLDLHKFDEWGSKIDSEFPVFSNLDLQQNETDLFIIKSTTLYGEDTYFFEGRDLHGGLYFDNNKYKGYSGNMFDIEKSTQAQMYIFLLNSYSFNQQYKDPTEQTTTTTTIKPKQP